MIKNGDALLSIYANDPNVFSGLDSDRIGAMQKAHLQNYQDVNVQVSRNAINWCVVASAAPAWAQLLCVALTDSGERLARDRLRGRVRGRNRGRRHP